MRKVTTKVDGNEKLILLLKTNTAKKKLKLP